MLLTKDEYNAYQDQPFCTTCHIKLTASGTVFQIPKDNFTWVDPNPTPTNNTTTNVSIDSNKCVKCNKEVFKAEEILSYGNKKWHKQWYDINTITTYIIHLT